MFYITVRAGIIIITHYSTPAHPHFQFSSSEVYLYFTAHISLHFPKISYFKLGVKAHYLPAHVMQTHN